MSTVTRAINRTSASAKRLVIDPDLHAILKVEAVTRDTSLFEVTHVLLCERLNRDPQTLEPLSKPTV